MPTTTHSPRTVATATEWALTALLAANLAWTTLCLGGFRPETMVVTCALNALLAALACLRAAQGGGRPWNRAVWWPVPFLVFALVNTLWLSPVGWLAWREWMLWAQMALVFVVALHFGRARAQTIFLAGTVVVIAVAASAMALYQRCVDPEWLMLGRRQFIQFVGRSSGSFGIPNSFAGLLELVLLPALAVVAARRASVSVRLIAAALAGLFGCALVLTVSRGAMLGVGAALLLWPIVAGRNWKNKIVGAVATVAAVAAIAVTLYHTVPAVRQRLEPVLAGKLEPSRPILWRAGWEIFRGHAWLGSGAASFNTEFERHRPPGFRDEPLWAHNDYLNTLSDYGAAGFALFFAAGVALLWLAWRARSGRESEGFPAAFRALQLGAWLGVVAFAVHLLVDFHLKIPALALTLATIMGLLLREPDASEPPATNPPSPPMRWSWLALGVLLALGATTDGVRVYHAEALRFRARWAIDDYAARGKGELPQIVANAQRDFARAVSESPGNAQAWADLSYAFALQAYLNPKAVIALGVEAERSAREALRRARDVPEFWLRLGVALDMQARQAEAEPCFTNCLQLAPNASHFWFSYAHRLASDPRDAKRALEAVARCLELDPSNGAATGLQQQLLGRR